MKKGKEEAKTQNSRGRQKEKDRKKRMNEKQYRISTESK